MKKYLFLNDYSEGAHPNILNILQETNSVQEIGYGEDSLSIKASDRIKEKINKQDAAAHFVSGGTQANLIVLASVLKPYESVVSATTAHINTHEAGAIEATGHKIDTIENPDGKLKPEQIEELVELHTDEHMVKPKLVFISNSTEVGTIYVKKELQEISDLCKKHDLYLYLDGARLGSALTCTKNDLTLSDIANLTDAFYLGGTKNGALLGEAIVVVNPELQKDFRRNLKQRGALLAKGRILGSQFYELFSNDLYFNLARHSNEMAGKLVEGISKLGYSFLTDSPTNQIFPILPNSLIIKLQQLYGFYVWSKADDNNSSIRLVTSWATETKAVNEFLSDLEKLRK
jgi:threonine aldolase